MGLDPYYKVETVSFLLQKVNSIHNYIYASIDLHKILFSLTVETLTNKVFSSNSLYLAISNIHVISECTIKVTS